MKTKPHKFVVSEEVTLNRGGLLSGFVLFCFKEICVLSLYSTI